MRISATTDSSNTQPGCVQDMVDWDRLVGPKLHQFDFLWICWTTSRTACCTTCRDMDLLPACLRFTKCTFCCATVVVQRKIRDRSKQVELGRGSIGRTLNGRVIVPGLCPSSALTTAANASVDTVGPGSSCGGGGDVSSWPPVPSDSRTSHGLCPAMHVSFDIWSVSECWLARASVKCGPADLRTGVCVICGQNLRSAAYPLGGVNNRRYKACS